MQVSEVEVLIVLAEELNMRKAAERLFVSQPALSQRLVTIEHQWGKKIFVRSTRGLALTPDGEKIIDFAKKMYSEEQELRGELTAQQGEVYGTLKIAVASIMGQYWLPRVLKRFVERYPSVRVKLVTGWSSEMMRFMLEENFHIGIIRGNPDWRGEKMKLFSDSLHLVDLRMTDLKQLKNNERSFIQFKSDSTYYQEILEWWQERFSSPPLTTLVVDQIETCKQMALHGIGFAILPESTIRDVEAINKIPLTSSDGTPLVRDTWMLSTESMLELEQVKAFWKIVDEVTKESVE
ncbi:LysR family transcriptional regulator [Exiguobacterium sp. AM39-5BH]|uniref:LysR family transcriptional regulator n=1 Tax=Exiguobacterium sp. AM39-5BH TaxID=2292355 RepID=UPI000FE20106|nr:LysR family transcriptional regulator [Exiguobacterium sp. AM39-5BH]RHB50632.1 LysR family transcriptional regulator [Exiguobacterium sp. AM39-5BH]